MATRKTRAEMKAETRERVLAAAERIALEQGLARITLEAVAQRAGMTKGAIYSNFGSKEELLFEVVVRLTPGMNAPETVFLEAPDLASFLDRLAGSVTEMANRRSKQAVLALEFETLAVRDAKVRRAIARETARERANQANDAPGPFEAWAAALAEPLPQPSDRYVSVLNAVAWGLLIRRLVYGPDVLPDDLIAWALARFGPDGDPSSG